MRCLTVLLSVVVSFVLLAHAPGALARPGDPRALQGVLAWTPGADGPPFIVVRGDDGRQYLADLATAQRRGDAVGIGGRISVVGVEGRRPWEITALAVGSGDTALAVVSSPPAGGPAPAADAARSWRRIQGRVDAIEGKTLTLRDARGAVVTVDTSSLMGDPAKVLRRGDPATVFVVAEGDQRLVAVGLVQTEATEGSALPRQPR
jgi:hypothetical protein